MFVGIYRGIIIPGFLRWCRISSIHRKTMASPEQPSEINIHWFVQVVPVSEFVFGLNGLGAMTGRCVLFTLEVWVYAGKGKGCRLESIRRFGLGSAKSPDSSNGPNMIAGTSEGRNCSWNLLRWALVSTRPSQTSFRMASSMRYIPGQQGKALGKLVVNAIRARRPLAKSH